MCITFSILSDTIPGRQCMASCFFLLKQFEDVLIYLNSVKVGVARMQWRVSVIYFFIQVKKKKDTRPHAG